MSHERHIPRAHWVTPGKLLAGEYPCNREAAKTRVLSVLRQRAQRKEAGLTNTEIRGITHFDRAQVKRLMTELDREGAVRLEGRGRASSWVFNPNQD